MQGKIISSCSSEWWCDSYTKPLNAWICTHVSCASLSWLHNPSCKYIHNNWPSLWSHTTQTIAEVISQACGNTAGSSAARKAMQSGFRIETLRLITFKLLSVVPRKCEFGDGNKQTHSLVLEADNGYPKNDQERCTDRTHYTVMIDWMLLILSCAYSWLKLQNTELFSPD